MVSEADMSMVMVMIGAPQEAPWWHAPGSRALHQAVPMLDDRNTKEHPHIGPFAVWSRDDNETGRTALLGEDRVGGPDIKATEAAGRAIVADVEGLPPTYMDVGQLDICVEEDLRYAQLPCQAGVPCELHLTPGLPHGGEAFIPSEAIAVDIMSKRFQAMTSF